MADDDIRNLGSGTTPVHDEKWERVLENIISKSTPFCQVGIYGIQICQECGRLGTYQGWCHAVMTHMTVNGKQEFICGGCIGRSPANKGTGSFAGSELADHATAVLATRPFRYCDICGARTEIAVQEKYDVKTWACSACEPKLSEKDFLSRLHRRRYVQHKCATYDELCAFDIQEELHKLEMEETFNAERRAQHSARKRAALQELERIHGRAYVHLLADEQSGRGRA